jgi:hypothetical protein
MKTNPPAASARAARQPKARRKQDCELAMRACEAAAARVKAAGDELAACWTALCREIAAGVSPTDLLRKRAWCNVLELRLKEQAHALEEARHAVDAVWHDLMLTARARELFHRFLRKSPTQALAPDETLPLLVRTASALAAAHRRALQAKK